MQRVPLAATGLEITRMVFGGPPIGGLFAPVSEDAARATLETAWTCGVRAFDTAPHCGAGLSEQRLGEFLGGKPRTEFVISTKVGRRLVAADADADLDGVERFYGTPRLTRVRDYSRDGVLASLEDSLTRLGLDRIDVALIHDPDDHAGTALDGAFPALAELRAAGVIGAIAARIRPYVSRLIDSFGPDRLMFGSDWPVCTLAASYSEVLDLALALLAGRLDPVEVDAVLAGNAARIYRLDGAASSGSQD